MPASGNSRANENRKIRQEALREFLSKKCSVEQVIDIANKLEDLSGLPMDSTEVQRLKSAADIKGKLINKYLPDVKSIELTGEDGEAIKVDNTWTIKVAK